jgi:hypothetical protein
VQKKEIEVEQVSEEPVQDTPTERIYNAIKALDKGDGVQIDDVLRESNEAEKISHDLLEKCDIFAVRKRRLKVLE